MDGGSPWFCENLERTSNIMAGERQKIKGLHVTALGVEKEC